MLMSTVTS
ncbi:uncharacterized protein FFFS_16009 [Fusarium fujikuroi]|nr:uncharacterized protein FFFS_16009 [Fusarium fujikuroi]